MENIYVATDHLFETNFIYYVKISDTLAPNYINKKHHKNILKHIYVSLRKLIFIFRMEVISIIFYIF